MLNIPESVKALFKADSIRKNFRVHFPNGELPDITNDNIVQESVQFTESLCSQDVLKFGLTEASVLEFETVGVANMYGMTIEAGIEIDLSSLSAAEIAEIAAGSWDGVYVSESDTDVGFPFFRVPYGVFRVESCPRDHQAMTHRKVQAYEQAIQQTVDNSPFEIAKARSRFLNRESYEADAIKLLYAGIGWYDPSFLDSLTKTDITPWDRWPPPGSGSYTFVAGNGIIIYFTNLKSTQDVLFDDSQPLVANSLYALDYRNGSNMETVNETLRGLMEEKSIPEDWIQKALDALNSQVPSCFYYYDREAALVFQRQDNGLSVFYPAGGYSRMRLSASASASIEIRVMWTPEGSAIPRTETVSMDATFLTEMPKLYQFSGLPTPLPITVKNTGKGRTSLYYTFVDAYDFQELLNAYMEINAAFGYVNRKNAFIIKHLNNESPEAIQPQHYSGFWWDEYDVQPIGTIKYTIGDGAGNDYTNYYEFGPGASVYDMTDNYLLKAMDSIDEDTVEDVFDEYFVPYLGPVAFTPIDLSMKGLPYLEAGDYLAVTGEDGATAYSFAMRQTINGVQVLTADIESTSGEILDSGEGAS